MLFWNMFIAETYLVCDLKVYHELGSDIRTFEVKKEIEKHYISGYDHCRTGI